MISSDPQEDDVKIGTPLVVQWLRLHVSTAGRMGSIPDGGTKILQDPACHAVRPKKK